MKKYQETIRKVLDEHLNREFLIMLGLEKAKERGLITDKEHIELILWLSKHPHKVYAEKRMEEAGLKAVKAIQSDTDKIIREASRDSQEAVKCRKH